MDKKLFKKKKINKLKLFKIIGEPSSKTKYNIISDSEKVPWGKMIEK
jgi:hypothetical protein